MSTLKGLCHRFGPAGRQSWKWLEDTDSSTYTSDVKTLNAHFDGKSVVLDEPIKLKPNTKVRVCLWQPPGMVSPLVFKPARQEALVASIRVHHPERRHTTGFSAAEDHQTTIR